MRAVVCLGLNDRSWDRASGFGIAHLVAEAAFVAGLAALEWGQRARLASGGASTLCARALRSPTLLLDEPAARVSDVRRAAGRTSAIPSMRSARVTIA